MFSTQPLPGYAHAILFLSLALASYAVYVIKAGVSLIAHSENGPASSWFMCRNTIIMMSEVGFEATTTYVEVYGPEAHYDLIVAKMVLLCSPTVWIHL